MLTSGGLAPCLSSSVAALVREWDRHDPGVELVGYRDGYAGLLTGSSIRIDAPMRAGIDRLHELGGSPLGNSRVKLSNREDCERRGLVAAGEDPLDVAVRQLVAAGIDVLHPVGGDDTAAASADLVRRLDEVGHHVTVVALPKTIDNDIVPVTRSLGAATAAEYGALFARNVIAEHSAAPRSMVIHEVMGRNCGWLTAATARRHQQWVRSSVAVPGLVDEREWGIHALLIPEIDFEVDGLIERLGRAMDRWGNVNLFVAEGAGAATIIEDRLAAGIEVPTDAFGHPRLDRVNVGEWVAERIGAALGADKSLVMKSGYFARSAPANAEDRALIDRTVTVALAGALERRSGVAGQDEEAGDELRVIGFERIRGGKRFDVDTPWFIDLQADLDRDL